MNLAGYLFLFAAFLHFANATPLPVNETCEAVHPEPLSKYSTDHFIEIRRLDIQADSCIYYTRTMGKTAIGYAWNHDSPNNYITVWDVWPCEYYNVDATDENNPLRDIMANDQERLTYFENMSRAYAQMCGGYNFVFTRDINKIPLDGIFGRVEYPAISRDCNFDAPRHEVIAVDAFSPDLSQCINVYKRSESSQSNVSSPYHSELVKRSPPDKSLPQCVKPQDHDTLYAFMEH